MCEDSSNENQLEGPSTSSTELQLNSEMKQLCSEMRYYIEDLLNKQWIIHSHSEYSSPVVAIRKKDGTIRLCCDYRKLNQKTVPDRHTLPRIQNVIDNLGGNKFFSLLDQSKAYHQLHLDPERRRNISFITPWGFCEWVRVPFGLMNAPACFERFMEQCLDRYRDDFVIPRWFVNLLFLIQWALTTSKIGFSKIEKVWHKDQSLQM